MIGKRQAVVTHTFRCSTLEAETGGSCEFEATLVYVVNSRTARLHSANPVSKERNARKDCVTHQD